MIAGIIFVAALAAAPITPPAPSDEVAAIHMLATASSTPVLESACIALRPRLWQTVAVRTQAAHNAQGDVAMQALSRFVLRPGNTRARIACLRELGDLGMNVVASDMKTMRASAYVADASRTIVQ